LSSIGAVLVVCLRSVHRRTSPRLVVVPAFPFAVAVSARRGASPTSPPSQSLWRRYSSLPATLFFTIAGGNPVQPSSTAASIVDSCSCSCGYI
jgi:hypothetical protein